MNTVKNGAYRWMVFRDGDAWIGVALEFNIVISGDDPKVVELELQEAVMGYLESAKSIKGFRDAQINSFLNQESDEEHEAMWRQATQTSNQTNEGVLSPLNGIYKAGVANLVAA